MMVLSPISDSLQNQRLLTDKNIIANTTVPHDPSTSPVRRLYYCPAIVMLQTRAICGDMYVIADFNHPRSLSIDSDGPWRI